MIDGSYGRHSLPIYLYFLFFSRDFLLFSSCYGFIKLLLNVPGGFLRSEGPARAQISPRAHQEAARKPPLQFMGVKGPTGTLANVKTMPGHPCWLTPAEPLPGGQSSRVAATWATGGESLGWYQEADGGCLFEGCSPCKRCHFKMQDSPTVQGSDQVWPWLEGKGMPLMKWASAHEGDNF